MKLVLLSQTLQPKLVAELHRLGHAVFMTTSDFDLATTEIFRARPNAVLICGKSTDAFVTKAQEFVALLPNQRLVLHEPGDSEDLLIQRLDKIRHQVAQAKHSPSIAPRMMFFDPGYIGHIDCRKRNQRKPEHAALLAEQDKLLLLLEQAASKQTAALRYRKEISKWEKDETREIAYTILHQSFKSAPYAQEELGRWLSILAHFIPGVDLCCLPPPTDPISSVRWIFYGSGPEVHYAFGCLARISFNESVREPLQSLIDHKFVPGNDALMAHAAFALLGCRSLIQDVTDAQLSLMDRYLGGKTQELLLHVQERAGRREHQIFTEFWNLPLLSEFPQLLAKTVDDFHRGRRTASNILAPRFLDILANCQRPSV